MADPHVPTLEMLWEASDPRGTLDERFGFADAVSAGHWVAATVYEHWGIWIDSCERIVISDRNALAWVTTPSGRLLAKWSVAPERFPRLSRIARLTHWLDGKGLPVSAPVQTLDGRLQVEVDEVSMGLQRVIEGEHVPQAARDALRGLVADAPADRPTTQLVHGDFRSSNVLCTGHTIAAVIDFESARLDHCIDEIARSAVMLGTRFRDWGPVSAEVRKMFMSGYQSVRRLTPYEASWWDVLVLWYTLAFVSPGDDPTGWAASALSQLAELAPRTRAAFT